MNEFYVYVLCRENGMPFYVGKGKGNRIDGHEGEARRGDTSHKARILRKMFAKGIAVPKFKVAEGMTNEMAIAMEIRLIAYFGREPNGPLVNKTNGGDGTEGYRHTDKAKAAVARAKVGKPIVGTHRENFIAAGKIAAQSPEARAKRIASLNSPEIVARVQLARCRPRSEQARANLKAAQQRPEVRAKISKANAGKKQDAHYRLVRSLALKRFWEKRKTSGITGALGGSR